MMRLPGAVEVTDDFHTLFSSHYPRPRKPQGGFGHCLPHLTKWLPCYSNTTMPTITFKVSPAEARTLRASAHAAKTTLSGYLRSQALPAAPPKRRIVLKKHPISGLTYNAAPGPMVTQAQIDAALADYP